MGPNQVKKQQLQQRLMQAIGLSSDQRMRMQEIRRSHVDELAAAGRRLRQSRQALDQAIMSEPYSEPDVRRATEALAAAQADKIRIDATVRVQVRGVLTPDQVQRFHQLQREMRREMKEQQQRNQDREQGLNRLTTPATYAEPGEIDLLKLVFPRGKAGSSSPAPHPTKPTLLDAASSAAFPASLCSPYSFAVILLCWTQPRDAFRISFQLFETISGGLDV